jgi:hypothetical protein
MARFYERPPNPPRPSRPLAWRKLTLEIAPEGIQVIWDDGRAETVPAAALQDGLDTWSRVRRAVPEVQKLNSSPPPPLNAGAAVGLYVADGAAKFRSVVITPLPRK